MYSRGWGRWIAILGVIFINNIWSHADVNDSDLDWLEQYNVAWTSQTCASQIIIRTETLNFLHPMYRVH